jgi:chemotaxis response regulator CheB
MTADGTRDAHHRLQATPQPDMPESAIASGYVDFVLSPEDMANAIVRISTAEA